MMISFYVVEDHLSVYSYIVYYFLDNNFGFKLLFYLICNPFIAIFLIFLDLGVISFILLC